jgi:hypothetical protein
MATVTINDLPASDVIDYKALSCITGGAGAPWVYAFGPQRDQVLPGLSLSQTTNNFFQTNNFFIADQLNIQVQNIDVETAADTAVVNVIAGQDSAAVKLGG